MALWAVWFLSFAVRKTFEADLDLAGSYGPFPESFSHGRTTSRADRRQSTSTGLDPPSLPYASSFTSHSSSSSTSNLDHTATPASPTSSVPLNEFGGKFDSSQSIPKMAGGVTTGLWMQDGGRGEREVDDYLHEWDPALEKAMDKQWEARFPGFAALFDTISLVVVIVVIVGLFAGYA
jgi:hypothetical protein